MSRVEAVLFDMDGLMIDSEGKQSISYEKVLNEHGVQPEYNKEGVIQTVGVKAIDNWQLLKDKHNLEPSVEELHAKKNKIYAELLNEGIHPQPGLIDLIADLNKSGVKMAIGSSSIKENILTVLDRLGLTCYFTEIISGEDVKHGKPAPDIYLEAARRLGVSPANWVVLEDASEGVKAAKAAGMKCIAVPNKYTKTHDFDSADLIVESLNELSWARINQLDKSI